MPDRSPASPPGAPRRTSGLGLLVGVALVAHLLVAASATRLPDWGDGAIFKIWSVRSARVGILQAYSWKGFPYDWLPLYLYVSKAVGTFYRETGLLGRFGSYSPMLGLLVKLPPIAFNLLAGVLVFRLARILHGPGRRPLIVAAAWLFNPSIALATDVFGYQDALHTTLLVLAALCLVEQRDLAAGLAIGLAALTKPQALVLLPPLLVYAGMRREGTGLLRVGGAALASASVALAPFALAGKLPDLLRVIRRIPRMHPYPSATADNLWWLLFPAGSERAFASDRAPLVLGASALVLGVALFGAATLFALARLWRRPSPSALVHLTAFLAFAFFLLATEIHENHLYALFPFLTLVAVGSRFRRQLLVLLTLTWGLNLYLALRWLAVGHALEVAQVPLSLLLSAVNLVAFGAWLRHLASPEAA